MRSIESHLSPADQRIIEDCDQMYKEMPLIELLAEENAVNEIRYRQKRLGICQQILHQKLGAEIERKLR